MADEEHLRPGDIERFVHLDRPGGGCGIGRRAVRDIRLEQSGRAALRVAALKVHGELVEGEGERCQVIGVDEPATAPRVVLRQRVREATALAHDDIALPSEDPTDADREQHEKKGHMEYQVPGLAQVALLGGNPGAAVSGRLTRAHPPMAATQVVVRGGQHVLTVGRSGELT